MTTNEFHNHIAQIVRSEPMNVRSWTQTNLHMFSICVYASSIFSVAQKMRYVLFVRRYRSNHPRLTPCQIWHVNLWDGHRVAHLVECYFWDGVMLTPAAFYNRIRRTVRTVQRHNGCCHHTFLTKTWSSGTMFQCCPLSIVWQRSGRRPKTLHHQIREHRRSWTSTRPAFVNSGVREHPQVKVRWNLWGMGGICWRLLGVSPVGSYCLRNIYFQQFQPIENKRSPRCSWIRFNQSTTHRQMCDVIFVCSYFHWKYTSPRVWRLWRQSWRRLWTDSEKHVNRAVVTMICLLGQCHEITITFKVSKLWN